MLTIGNSEFNGKHVFNGQLTDIAPYSSGTAMNDKPDTSEILFEIGVGIKLPVNVAGNKVFGEAGSSDNAFKVVKDIIDALGSSNFAGIEDALGRLNSRMNSFLEVRADIGAKMNRIELSEQRLNDIDTNLQTLQSKTEDIDMAEAITNLKTSENVYQSSLSVGAKIIRPSLIDFLR
jgi:flagellar hook-associated protein 3 FlgL